MGLGTAESARPGDSGARPQGQCRMSSRTGRAISQIRRTGRGVIIFKSVVWRSFLSFLCGGCTKWLHGTLAELLCGFYGCHFRADKKTQCGRESTAFATLQVKR